jgi:hypothetical protein
VPTCCGRGASGTMRTRRRAQDAGWHTGRHVTRDVCVGCGGRDINLLRPSSPQALQRHF